MGFGVLYKGTPIFEVQNKEQSRSVSIPVPIPGLVPEYEVFSVRQEAGYNEFEWIKLDPEVKAKEIAHYRIRHTLEHLMNQDAIAKSKQRSKS